MTRRLAHQKPSNSLNVPCPEEIAARCFVASKTDSCSGLCLYISSPCLPTVGRCCHEMSSLYVFYTVHGTPMHVTRWEWKCWRGCVYLKASSSPLCRKNNKGIHSHPVIMRAMRLLSCVTHGSYEVRYPDVLLRLLVKEENMIFVHYLLAHLQMLLLK